MARVKHHFAESGSASAKTIQPILKKAVGPLRLLRFPHPRPFSQREKGAASISQ